MDVGDPGPALQRIRVHGPGRLLERGAGARRRARRTGGRHQNHQVKFIEIQ